MQNVIYADRADGNSQIAGSKPGLGDKTAMAELFTRLDKGLDASQIAGVQMDHRSAGCGANGVKKPFDTVGEGVGLIDNGTAGTLARKRQNRIVNAFSKLTGVDLGQTPKRLGSRFKGLNGAFELRRSLRTASGPTFFDARRVTFLTPEPPAFLTAFRAASLEIDLGCSLGRRLVSVRLAIIGLVLCRVSTGRGHFVLVSSGKGGTVFRRLGCRQLGRLATVTYLAFRGLGGGGVIASMTAPAAVCVPSASRRRASIAIDTSERGSKTSAVFTGTRSER